MGGERGKVEGGGWEIRGVGVGGGGGGVRSGGVGRRGGGSIKCRGGSIQHVEKSAGYYVARGEHPRRGRPKSYLPRRVILGGKTSCKYCGGKFREWAFLGLKARTGPFRI